MLAFHLGLQSHGGKLPGVQASWVQGGSLYSLRIGVELHLSTSGHFIWVLAMGRRCLRHMTSCHHESYLTNEWRFWLCGEWMHLAFLYTENRETSKKRHISKEKPGIGVIHTEHLIWNDSPRPWSSAHWDLVPLTLCFIKQEKQKEEEEESESWTITVT